MTPEDFFNTYKDWAIQTMAKSGTPASITLAQAALESGYGESKLALTANNFFGIKVPGLPLWFGDYVLANDDKPDEKFRKYATVYDSFIDHADFLKLNSRYDSLFNDTDYKNWANGLQSAGYATSPTYASSLIDTIEKYGLDQYDKEGAAQMGTVTNTVIRKRFTIYKVILVAILVIALWLVWRQIQKSK